MHPQKLHDFIVSNNAAIFDAFIDFPKPIIIAANGPAIGKQMLILNTQQMCFNALF